MCKHQFLSFFGGDVVRGDDAHDDAGVSRFFVAQSSARGASGSQCGAAAICGVCDRQSTAQQKHNQPLTQYTQKINI